MKRHSRNTLVSLTALALGATVLLTGCSEDAAGSTAETASVPAAPVQSSDTTVTGATAAQTSELLASLTHEEMEGLISGNTTLAELEQKRFNLPLFRHLRCGHGFSGGCRSCAGSRRFFHFCFPG